MFYAWHKVAIDKHVHTKLFNQSHNNVHAGEIGLCDTGHHKSIHQQHLLLNCVLTLNCR